MRNNTVLTLLVGLGIALALFTAPAAAQFIPGLGHYDTPSAVIEIPPSGLPGTGDAVTCIYYTDAMLRLSGVDTPSPDNGLIVLQKAQARPPKCERRKPGGIEVQSGGSYLVGRLSDFLVFELSDPTGASQFSIFNVRNGHLLFRDGLNGADGYHGIYGITSIKVVSGILHIRYLRGVNANCSLLSDRTGCWAELLANDQIPIGAFAGPPSLEICRDGYGSDPVDQRSPDPDGDPSIVSYEVALTLDSKGEAQVLPIGSLRCEPMP